MVKRAILVMFVCATLCGSLIGVVAALVFPAHEYGPVIDRHPHGMEILGGVVGFAFSLAVMCLMLFCGLVRRYIQNLPFRQRPGGH